MKLDNLEDQKNNVIDYVSESLGRSFYHKLPMSYKLDYAMYRNEKSSWLGRSKMQNT